MSRNLPALPPQGEIEPVRLQARETSRGSLGRWISTPVAETVAALAPDVLRLIGRGLQARAERREETPTARSGADGVTISEVEIAVSAPFIRRVVVRSATTWSVAPEILLAEQRRGASRRKLRAVGLAGLAVLGLAAARRSPLRLPARLRRR